ncbi:MAG: DUF4124 domain-containing protein [Thiotrichaceae bacterium]
MKYITPTSTALLLFTIATSASAQIYKWVDESGQQHYTERPAPAGKNAEAIEDKIRFAAALRSKNKTRSSYIPSKTKDEAENDAGESKRKEIASKQKEAQDNYKEQLNSYCTSQKDNLKLLRTGSPIAWEENGKTDLLTVAQRTTKIDEISKSVSKNCSDKKSKSE